MKLLRHSITLSVNKGAKMLTLKISKELLKYRGEGYLIIDRYHQWIIGPNLKFGIREFENPALSLDEVEVINLEVLSLLADLEAEEIQIKPLSEYSYSSEIFYQGLYIGDNRVEDKNFNSFGIKSDIPLGQYLIEMRLPKEEYYNLSLADWIHFRSGDLAIFDKSSLGRLFKKSYKNPNSCSIIFEKPKFNGFYPTQEIEVYATHKLLRVDSGKLFYIIEKES